MNIGNINNAWMAAYQYVNKTQRNNTAETDSTGFLSAVSAKQAEKTDRTSLEDMWKLQYPGAYYHVMDGSKISQAAWERNDFPFEKFFSDNVDESILDWQPSGAEPSDYDSEVITRRSSVAGQKAVIIPSALEQKMHDDPALAEKVMANIDNFIATYNAEPGCSYLIDLNENGEISKFCVTGPLRFSYSVSGHMPTELDKLHEDFERIAKENVVKRKLQQKSIEKKYQSSVTDKEEINWDELAFEHAGPNAPQSVKDAWMEASKEAGANGLGYTSNGINVTEMHVQEFLKWYWGGKKAEFQDVLGNSVESAIQAAQQALYNFDHPLEPNKVMSIEEQQARVKERQFYVTFLEKLENLLNE